MTKFKKLLAVVLSAAILLSTFAVSGAMAAKAAESNTVVFDFDTAYSFTKPNPANTGAVNDADGNAY